HERVSVARWRGRRCSYAPACRRVRSSLRRSSTSEGVRADAVPREILPDPVDRPGEAVVERDVRLPTEQLPRRARVGAEALDLARRRAHALLVALDRRPPPELRPDPLDQLADRG